MHDPLSYATAIMAFVAALCWLRAGTVKVSDTEAVRRLEKRAEREGKIPNYGRMSFDGWDVRETFADQTKWNAAGALAAAFAALLQGIGVLST